jgi:hypothetical protein
MDVRWTTSTFLLKSFQEAAEVFHIIQSIHGRGKELPFIASLLFPPKASFDEKGFCWDIVLLQMGHDVPTKAIGLGQFFSGKSGHQSHHKRLCNSYTCDRVRDGCTVYIQAVVRDRQVRSQPWPDILAVTPPEVTPDKRRRDMHLYGEYGPAAGASLLRGQ